jgi:putative YphP/YqiW family bacilliredoxin
MFNLNLRQPTYDPVAVQPMRDELTGAGFTEMLTPEDVQKYLDRDDDKTVLVMINSVCGCAAGSARPGVTLALQNNNIPDVLVTSFAGQDKDALDELRGKYFPGITPSSPFLALFKGNELVYLMQRYDIEGKPADMIAGELATAFNEFCTKQGPSISPEEFANLPQSRMCGSKVPLAK